MTKVFRSMFFSFCTKMLVFRYKVYMEISSCLEIITFESVTSIHLNSSENVSFNSSVEII
jgi:hypothetical protein